MKLRVLEVKDIASYKYCKIDFDKIIYPLFITGKTGSGKTTFFVDAIVAALFGAPYGTKNLLKAFITEGKRQGVIKLTFEVDGELYTIRRVIKRNSPSDVALLDYRGKVLATGKEAEKKIRKLIGMDEKTLIATLIVRQGEVQNLILAKPSELRNLFMKMLNLEFFSKLREKVREFRSQIRNKIAELTGELRETQREISKEQMLRLQKQKILREIESLENDIAKLSGKKEELEAKRNELLKSLGAIKGKIETLKKEVDELDELVKERDRIEREIKKISAEIERVGREKIEKASEFSNKFAEYYKLESEINLLKSEVERIRKDIQRIIEVKKLEEKIKELKKVEDELEEKLREKEDLRDKISKLKAKINEISNHIEELNKAEARCPVCGSILTEERKQTRMKELLNEKENLKKELKESKEKYDILDRNIFELEKKRKELIKLEGMVRTLKKSIENWDATEDDLARKNDELQASINKLNSLRDEILKFTGKRTLSEARIFLKMLDNLRSKLLELQTLKEKLIDINKRIEEKEKRVGEVKHLQEEYEKINNEFTRIDKLLKTVNDDIESRRERLNNLKGRLQEIEKMLRELDEKKVKIVEIKKQIDELRVKDEAYAILESAFAESGFPLHLLENFLSLVENYTNEYLSNFGMNIEVELKRDRRGTGVELVIYSEGRSRDKKTFSGGEQTIIGFALRLGISRALVDYFTRGRIPKFLIIDEGFGPLDEDLRKKVVDALYALYSGGEFEQMIVISHQSELRNSPIFRSIFEVRKERGISYLVNENGEIICETES